MLLVKATLAMSIYFAIAASSVLLQLETRLVLPAGKPVRVDELAHLPSAQRCGFGGLDDDAVAATEGGSDLPREQ